MPRDISGVYTLPEAPFVPITTIESLVTNSDLNDVALALTQSLATTGVTTMEGPIRLVDGTISAPSLTFSQATGVGFYRSGTNQVRWVVNTSILATFNSNQTVDWIGDHAWDGGITVAGTLTADDVLVSTSTPNNSTYQGRPITAIDSGRSMVFTNAAVPTGWFLRTVNNFAIRVMSTGGVFGGVTGFSTVFGQTASDNTTPDNLAHTHSVNFAVNVTVSVTPNFLHGDPAANTFFTFTTQNFGTGSIHSHTYDIRTLFLDVILGTKS